uniref:Telomerase RNA component interacting RNase n=1 Tax=Salmo trutta TaxID=8032 RepID=A0A673Z3L9_SALTR
MDPKRGYNRRHQNSSDSSSNSPGSPASPAPGVSKAAAANSFANDGSFMEMFKKKMEEEKMKKEMDQGCGDKSTAEEGQSTQEKKTPSVTSFMEGKGDAWTKYMAEVKKYKAHQCGDDDKTRPLVK